MQAFQVYNIKGTEKHKRFVIKIKINEPTLLFYVQPKQGTSGCIQGHSVYICRFICLM